MTSNTLLHAQNISKTFKDGEHSLSILNDVSLHLEKASTLAIVGASGSGKSTLLHILGTLEHADSGTVECDGKLLNTLSKSEQASFRNKSLGFVYQFHHLLPEFSALENIAMPLLIAGVAKRVALEKSSKLLIRVGLQARANHRPSQLSGGERQRIAIARALVNDPKLVLADEPTGNLDAQTSQMIYQLISEINKETQTSFILVTHDNELAAKMHHSYILKNGQLSKLNLGE
ncbi:lipoprotein-releasing ABC transporter ATP-binding protein LolD [Glaciecola sp. KUL10]|uniref:lipoprotein-releasing ABC transporter ATP-binding protein LolD n=1 Tax=Glaciecola sp. (strain KUL10) TaxID=2161813 RepID=UPI000D784908|nr:lipoprotein-releasing ABC transporter ATP-binding protein LolD [Glaciecola sp. KUL10]